MRPEDNVSWLCFDGCQKVNFFLDVDPNYVQLSLCEIRFTFPRSFKKLQVLQILYHNKLPLKIDVKIFDSLSH